MQATTEMIEAGAEYLYGNSRKSAVSANETAKFEACYAQAETVFNRMMAVQAQPANQLSQQQLAEAAPAGKQPNMW